MGLRRRQPPGHRPERQPPAYCGEAVQLSVEGPVKILGPSVVPLRGGMAGTYLATTGEAGRAVLHCKMEGALDTEAALTVRKRG